jgi:hypothetical protein
MEYNSEKIVAGRHKDYTARINQWRFLQDSYEGGIAYKSKNYLTRYVNETESEYRQRVIQTPFDNHCRSIVSIYNSFIFKNPLIREFGIYSDNPLILSILKDADRENRSLDSFMSDVNITATIFGHALVIVDKPEVSLNTRAEEIDYDVRPYVTMFNPIQILDWDYKQNINGTFYLSYLKLWESGDDDTYVLKEFTPEVITRYYIEKDAIETIETFNNPLGVIPAVIIYSSRTPVRGIGNSDIDDIADVQRSIFDANSEIEQITRLSNHPSLVITPQVKASAGAGAIIQIPEDLDAGLKPYLLQPSAANIDSVRQTIKDRIETINRMANVGGVRQQESKKISGVALEQEFELLNAKLSEKANNLELGENQIWDLICKWSDWDPEQITIIYPDSFNARDKEVSFELLSKGKEIASVSPTLYNNICYQIAELFVDDADQLEIIFNEIQNKPQDTLIHSTTTPETRSAHIQEMIMEGLEDSQILELHPEITQNDINAARQQLLRPQNETN